MSTCSNGHAVEATAAFCSTCGVPLSPLGQPATDSATTAGRPGGDPLGADTPAWTGPPAWLPPTSGYPPPGPPPAWPPSPYPQSGHPAPSSPAPSLPGGYPTGYPPPGYPPPGYGPMPGPGTNGFAIASLVLGIIWIFGLGSLLALIFGLIARSQIDRTGRRQGGRGMAIAGIVLGIVGLLGAIALIVVGAVTNDNSGTNSSSVSDCRAAYTTVQSAVQAFKAQTGAYPGGSLGAGVAVSPDQATGAGAAIADLTGTATDSNKNATYGPWLALDPFNSDDGFQIMVSNDGLGTVSVYDTGDPPAQVGSTNSILDCDLLG
jgi:Domain of unknown function (DUF4190)